MLIITNMLLCMLIGSKKFWLLKWKHANTSLVNEKSVRILITTMGNLRQWYYEIRNLCQSSHRPSYSLHQFSDIRGKWADCILCRLGSVLRTGRERIPPVPLSLQALWNSDSNQTQRMPLRLNCLIYFLRTYESSILRRSNRACLFRTNSPQHLLHLAIRKFGRFRLVSVYRERENEKAFLHQCFTTYRYLPARKRSTTNYEYCMV